MKKISHKEAQETRKDLFESFVLFVANLCIMIIRGFKTAAVAAGIKAEGALDLSLIYSEKPAVKAAVFPQNTFIPAPIVVFKMPLRRGHEVRVRWRR